MSSARLIRAMLWPAIFILTASTVATAFDPTTVRRLPPEHTDIRREFLDYVSES